MSNINQGNKEEHYEKLSKLKDIYSFTDDDLMKLSCFLTQVKRTAYKMELKSPAALVFYSAKKCTGKSTLMTMIKKAVLYSYQKDVHLRNFTLEQVFSRFNPKELLYDLVITIDEIGWLKKDISAQFKTLVTEINEVAIEEKYKGKFYGRKLANFIITSNDDPADLFFYDAHERRLSVIENFQKIQDMTEEALYEVVSEVWQSTPLEYAYDTNKLMELNLNRVRTNDEMFEALLWFYNKWFTIEGCGEFGKGSYTIASLYERFRQLNREISKKLIKSYLETTTEYFREQVSGRLHRYYFTKKLISDLQEASKEEGDDKAV